MKEEMKQLDARMWTMEFFMVEQRGTMSFVSVEEKEDVNKLNLFFKQRKLQLGQKLAQKMVNRLGATCHRNFENKIIKQNNSVLLRDLKQIHSKIFKQTSF